MNLTTENAEYPQEPQRKTPGRHLRIFGVIRVSNRGQS